MDTKLAHRIGSGVLAVGLLAGAATFADQPQEAGDRPSPLSSMDRVKDRLGEIGIELDLGYTLISQVASRVEEPQRWVTTGRFDIEVAWNLFEDETYGSGTIGLLVEGGHVFGHHRGEDLTENVGSLLGLNGAYERTSILVSQLWYEHSLFEEQFTITLGKVDLTEYFDGNALANDENEQFLSSALVNNPAIAFPDEGLGVVLRWQPDDHWYVALAWADAAAVRTHGPTTSLSEGHWFLAGEVGVHHTFVLDKPGTIRLIAWGADVGDVSGGGIAISVDQMLTEHVVAFVRAGLTRAELADAQRAVSGGLGYLGAFGRADDLAAVGIVHARAGDRSLRDETLVEGFYRLQFNDHLAISPLLQVVMNPAESRTGRTVVIAGVRVRVAF